MYLRILRTLLLCFLSLSSVSLYAQMVVEPLIMGNSARGENNPPCLNNAQAGSTTRTLHPASRSNDKRFLCAGDSLVIVHNRNQNLSEDPIPATIPGIAYILYDCPPQRRGATWADVKLDPCLKRTPIVTGNPPMSVSPPEGVWLARRRGVANGDANFANDGSMQLGFNGGRPIKLYYAPATIYHILGDPPFNYPSAEGDASCVDVNINDRIGTDTFSLVYLNAIRVSNIVLNNGRTGSFNIAGGLPEYDGSAYTIEIFNENNPAILGTVTSQSLTSANFTVPQDGAYIIRVLDGKSCDAFARVAFPVANVQFSEETAAATGDEVCVKFSATGFTNVASMQLRLKFDPAVLQFTRVINTSSLPSLDNSAVNVNTATGFISFIWINSSGFTRADNSTIFELCFRAIGTNGSFSAISFLDTLNGNELADPNDDRFGLNTRNGLVRIGASNFTLRVSGDSVRCSGETNGRLRIVPTGTGAPFQYVWQSATNSALIGTGQIPANDSAVVANLPVGKYYVTVTNTGSVQRIDSFDIRAPQPIFIALPTVRNPTCPGATDGTMTLTGFGGGTRPYTFVWSNMQTGTSISGLTQGFYTVVLTDAKGCRDSIRQSIGVNPIEIVTRNFTNASCNGIDNGVAEITAVQGGTTANPGRYRFTWSTGATNTATNSRITSLRPGVYYVTIQDDNNCSIIDSFRIGAQRTLAASANLRNIACFGQTNGSITVSASAIGVAAPPYRFTWSPTAGIPTNTPTTSRVVNLSANPYTLQIRDNDGCTLDTIFTITTPDSIRIDTLRLRNESCTAGNDGEISLAISGGTTFSNGQYRYRWSRTPLDTFSVLTALVAGNYTVTVTDSLGCSKQRTFTILAPVLPIIDSISVTNARCAESLDGTAKVFARGVNGAAITTYRWSNTGTLDNILGVGKGRYYVTVTDQNGCRRVDSAFINAPEPLTIDTPFFVVQNPTCPKGTTGEISLVIKGGTLPYTYSWSGGPNSSNPIFATLSAGTYTFTVTDFNGCLPLTTSITLVDPPSISTRLSNTRDVSCYGKCNPGDGRATVTATGGTVNSGLYTFTWSNGESCNNTNTCTANLLCQGWQKVSISDLQCGVIDSVFIAAPDSFSFDTPLIVQPNCNGERNGSAEIRVLGGTPPYSYLWSNGNNSSRIVNVGSGNYSVFISDRNLCTFSYNIQIQQPDSLKLDTVAAKTFNVSCFNKSDGQIVVARVGGNSGATRYTWRNNVGSTDSIANLRAGSYSVTVSDEKGCADSLDINILQPNPIFYFLSRIEQPRCYGDLTNIKLDTAFGSYNAFGLNYPFFISVDNGPQYPIGYFVPVFAGEHRISIVEQTTGCQLDTSVIINQPPPLEVRFDTTINPIQTARFIVGLGDSLRFNPIITSSLPIDSVRWTPRDYLVFTSDSLRPYVRPLDDRTYRLRVTDVNGCVGEGDVLIELDRNRNVFVPNIFTPNGDDKNDFFNVFSGVGVKNVNFMRIYDRWGELIFEKTNMAPTSDAALGWDGKFRNDVVPNGVYIYVIEVVFEDGQKLLYRGDVTVAR
jgi:gliding motility-associated-like protein